MATVPAIPTLSPTAVRVVGLEPEHNAVLQRFAAWNREDECPVAPGEVTEAMRACVSHNLLDTYNRNASLALQFEALQGRYQKLSDEHKETQRVVIDLSECVSQQKAEIGRLQCALVTAQPFFPVSVIAPNLAETQDIAAPDPFSGDCREYQTFKAQLTTKLAGDAHKFRSEQHRMQYMANLLRGNAYKMVLPFIKTDRIDLGSTNELWGILDAVYDDPNKKRTAERELETLKQENREFSVYFADFQRLMAELRWDESARRSALYRGLSGEMKDLLRSYPRPSEWGQYIHLLQELDSKIRARSDEKKSKPLKPAPSRPAHQIPEGPASQLSTADPEWHRPAPVCFSAVRRESGRQGRYEERRGAGVCTDCGLPGHYRASCPQRQRNPGTAPAPTRAAEGQTRSPTTDGTLESQELAAHSVGN